MKYKVCTITGHRPQRFKFKYNEHYALCVKIKKSLERCITEFYEMGVRQFWVGGSIGVDTWAAEIILELKKKEKYKDMELCIAIPFPEYDEKFDNRQKARLRDIMVACTDSVIISEKYSKNAYEKRNRYMIDKSDCVIAVYDNNRSLRSGTGMTVHYAEKSNRQIVYIHPDTAAEFNGGYIYF